MAVSYKVNVYDYKPNIISPLGSAPSPTEQGQGKTVRQVLEEFARDGSFQARSNNRFTYADSFRDDEPLSSERLDNLMDSPDLSQMDAFEVHDLVMDNLEEVKKKDDKNEDPPDPEVLSED